jgi:glucosamine-6-phosphate deaminase
MKIVLCNSKAELGRQAAAEGADLIRTAVRKRGTANIILATGASQFELLGALVKHDLPWHKVTAFHLDEYVGLPITHPASFRKYLWERVVRRLKLPFAEFQYVNGECDPGTECLRLGALISQRPIDVAFVGIGENGHLAFNDPPADFQTEEPYLVVKLDDACRRQQMREGWFKALADVPRQAISMSCCQIMKAQAIIAAVPDARKARAVKACLLGAVSPDAPASILQQHPQVAIYLDQDSASELALG